MQLHFEKIRKKIDIFITKCIIQSQLIAEQYAKPLSFFSMGFATLIYGCLLYADPATELGNLVDKLANVICNTFLIAGVILLAFSIGQLVMAFKNDDADSKTKASTQLAIALVLIMLKNIVKSLNLGTIVKNSWTT